MDVVHGMRCWGHGPVGVLRHSLSVYNWSISQKIYPNPTRDTLTVISRYKLLLYLFVGSQCLHIVRLDRNWEGHHRTLWRDPDSDLVTVQSDFSLGESGLSEVVFSTILMVSCLNPHQVSDKFSTTTDFAIRVCQSSICNLPCVHLKRQVGKEWKTVHCRSDPSTLGTGDLLSTVQSLARSDRGTRH